MNKQLKRVLQIGLTLFIVAFLVIYKTGWFRNTSSENPQQINRLTVLPVTVVKLESSTMEISIKSAGTLIPEEEVSVTTEVSGMVSAIHFEDGMTVKKGDLLVRINDDELQAQLEKAEHQRDLVRQTLERQEVLLKKDAISLEAFDKVKTDLLVLDSEVQLLNVKISKTYIKAPFSGRVGFRNVSQGSYLQPGMVITRLVKTSPLRLEFAVPERYQSEKLTGRNVQFTVAGFNDQFTAEIYAKEPQVDERTRSLVLRSRYANTDQRLLPGMFANITVPIQRLENVVQVPAQAIIPEMNGETVFLYKNGVALKQNVVTGIRNENNVAITEGLAAGDSVITSGILQLRHQMPVKVQ
ncbi:MAG TPA: efflux RND transporter periplasmic adaptor subunit [Marinilabiliaceae bacterium]|nr:efflux RND transporter periplasmic adaptor subunit [Marinilabiliaceae bacterium]